MAVHFADRLCDAVKSKKTALIVGLDPVYSRLPSAIKNRCESSREEFDDTSAVDAIFDFCIQTMQVISPMVPANGKIAPNTNVVGVLSS